MTSPGIAVDVEHVRGIVDAWSSGGKRLSALGFPEFAAASAPGSAVATALRSLTDPSQRACADVGGGLVGLAQSADRFLHSTVHVDSSAAQAFPGHR
jgi:hypothetical protein